MDAARQIFRKFDSWLDRPRWKDGHPFDQRPQPVSEKELFGSINRVERWVAARKWRGYDPFDVKELSIYRKTKWMPDDAGYGTKMLRYVLYKGEELHPLLMRRLFLIRGKLNPKGVGLFAHSYCLLSQLYPNDPCYPARGEKCLDWLAGNKLKDYHGICWGYPFNWESIIPIPKNTPSAVVSTTIGSAFLEWYLYRGKTEHLEICKGICEFLLKDLTIDHIGAEKVCFSYTPIDKYHVHNANLLTAAFLARTGSIIGNDEYVATALKAVEYTLAEQRADGSFFYWGPPSDKDYSLRKEQYELVDHLHTGYVLRALDLIFELTGKGEILDSIKLGFDFYQRKLFEHEFVPKYQVDGLYPVDIHFCAEAILSLSSLDHHFPGTIEIARKIAGWVIEHFQDRNGYFYASMRENGFQRIGYMRWGQAWMLLALASLALNLKEESLVDV